MARYIRDRIFPGDDPEPGAWAAAMQRARIPARYQRARTSPIQDVHLRDWTERMLGTPKRWLGEGYGFMFVGPYRSGKSSLAAIFAMDAVQRCEPVLWLTARDVPGVMFREDEEAYRLLHRCGLLVLDDLGAEVYRMDSGGGAALEAAVRNLYDRDRSVIVTSNLSPAKLQDRYPESLVSVLQRMTVVRQVTNAQWPKGPEGLS